ncbi:MAG: hypothetical protein GYA12_14475 [Chloroflexi bacterium]|nr:hypothetical protein [Chloroflexota bacterium]
MMDINSEITELLAQAMRAIQFGHKQAAAAYLNRILEMDPDNMDAWRWLAECMPNQEKRNYCLERAGLTGSSLHSYVPSRNSFYTAAPSLIDVPDDTPDPTLAEKHARKAALRGQKKAELPPHYHTAMPINFDLPKASAQNRRPSQTQANVNRVRQQNTVIPLARKPLRKPRKTVSFKGLGCSILVLAIFVVIGYGFFSTGITSGDKAWKWLSTQIENNLAEIFSRSETNSDNTVSTNSVMATFFPTPAATPVPDSVIDTAAVREAAEVPAEIPQEAPVEQEASEPAVETQTTQDVSAAPVQSQSIPIDNDPNANTGVIDDSPVVNPDSGVEVDSNTVTFDSPVSSPAPSAASVQPSDSPASSDNSSSIQDVAASASPAVATSSEPNGYVKGPIVIGKSIKGNNIEIMQFGNGPVERLMVAGVHGGNEWNTTALADELIAYIMKNPKVIPGDRTLYILRLLNPDGEERGHNLDGRTNERGVDINRNFDAFWVVDWPRDGCWNYRPISAGSEPFSEPESAALRDFVKAHNISAMINYHSAAMGIFAGGNPPDADSINLAKSISAVTDYAYPPVSSGCKYTGQMADWMSLHGIAAVDLELSNHTDTDFSANLTVLNVLMKWEPVANQKTLTGLIKIAESLPDKPSLPQQVRKFGVQTLNTLNGIIFGVQEEK